LILKIGDKSYVIDTGELNSKIVLNAIQDAKGN